MGPWDCHCPKCHQLCYRILKSISISISSSYKGLFGCLFASGDISLLATNKIYIKNKASLEQMVETQPLSTAPEEGITGQCYKCVLYVGDMTCSLEFLALGEFRYLYLCSSTGSNLKSDEVECIIHIRSTGFQVTDVRIGGAHTLISRMFSLVGSQDWGVNSAHCKGKALYVLYIQIESQIM